MVGVLLLNFGEPVAYQGQTFVQLCKTPARSRVHEVLFICELGQTIVQTFGTWSEFILELISDGVAAESQHLVLYESLHILGDYC